jgi:hypothetical protein
MPRTKMVMETAASLKKKIIGCSRRQSFKIYVTVT